MSLVLSDISHDYGAEPILEHISASINPGERIGLVGPNGAGKTTLLRIITGDLDPARGAVTRSPGRIGYVPQHLEVEARSTVEDYLLADTHALRKTLQEHEASMAGCDPTDEVKLASILNRYQHDREIYDELRGDHAEEDAERILEQVGLPVRLKQEIRTLSGGEQNTLSLAKALTNRPELLILDEPGNHLDFEGLSWLESFLSGFGGSVLVVSHNRYLLDRVATHIWEIFGRRLTRYAGNYSDYRFERLSKAISDQAVWSVQQQKIRRLEDLVRTFEERARTTGDPKWGKRLRSRRTQLEKTRDRSLDQPEVSERAISVSFSAEGSKSDIAVEVKSYHRAVGTRVLLDSADLLVHVGERVGIVGPNGCGKTTFLGDLVSQGNWNNPGMRIGPSMAVGYCAQQRGRYAPDTSLLDALLTHGNYTRHEVFGVMSRFLFTWEDLERPVGSLSGGEWNRLQLAAAILQKSNLLILDEPTNHLDIPSREAVEEALEDFDGTVIAVSHDRYFLDAVTRRIVEIQDESFVSHPGSFSEFWFSRFHQPVAQASLEKRKKQTTQRRQSPRDTDDTKTEKKILELEDERARLEREMTLAFEKRQNERGRKLAKDVEKVRKRLEDLVDQWGAHS